MNNNIGTLIIGLSNCGKTYLMNYTLLRRQKPIFIITRSLNQYPNIKAQTSDENQPLENYGKSIVVFDDMLLSKQGSNFDLFFRRGRHKNFDKHFNSQSYFHLPNNITGIISNIIILFKQTLSDIIILFHEIAGLDMNLDEWKELCRESWEMVLNFYK